MAKNNKEQLPDIPETMEDYMLQQLKKTVILKDGKVIDIQELATGLSYPDKRDCGVSQRAK